MTIDLEPDAVKEEKPGSKAQAKPAARAKSTPSAGKTSSTRKAAQSKAAGDAASKDEPAATPTKSAEQVKTESSENAPAAASGGKEPESKTDPASEKRSESPPPAAPAQSSGGRPVLTAVIAAVVAIALFAGLQWAGVLPALRGTAGASADVTAELEALKTSLAALEQRATEAGTDVGSALEDRLAALETEVKSSSLPSDIGQRIDSVESRVADLVSSTGSGSDTDSSGALTAISDKVTALESSQSGQESTLTDLKNGLASLSSKIEADESAQGQSIKSIDDRLSAIEKTLAAPRQDIKVARALAAASLKAAIDRGGSFMAELEALATVDGNSPALDQLRTLAASGVPSRSTLLSEFPSVANAIIGAVTTGDSSGGLFDHLVGSATSLIKVRPVGEVSGDSAEAIVARMETRLKNGNLQGAMDEWNTLPEAGKDASQAYANSLKARIEAESLVSSTLSAAMPSDTGTAAESGASNGSTTGATSTGEQN